MHFLIIVAHETSCEVYPSGYAYLGHSVNSHERVSANCRNYPSGLQANVYTENYVYCNGTQLRLTDSDYGSEQYSSSVYYVWPASYNTRLLFIFPTRVNLTTITLHYYSDSIRGLPRLRFWAVPDDFEAWKSLSGSYNHVEIAHEVPLGGGPTGHRMISVGINFNTRKLLMSIYSSVFSFAVSEVQFFNQSCKCAIYTFT